MGQVNTLPAFELCTWYLTLHRRCDYCINVGTLTTKQWKCNVSLINFAQGCQRVVEDWQKILQVRSLVLSPQEDMKSWLKYASLCRKSGRLALSHKTLVTLLGTDPSKQADQPLPTTYPQVTFAYMKHMWNENKKVWEDRLYCCSLWILSLKRNRSNSV